MPSSFAMCSLIVPSMSMMKIFTSFALNRHRPRALYPFVAHPAKGPVLRGLLMG